MKKAMFLILVLFCLPTRSKASDRYIYSCPIPTTIFFHIDPENNIAISSKIYAFQALHNASQYYDDLTHIRFNIVSREVYSGVLWNDPVQLITDLGGDPSDIMLRIIFTNAGQLYKSDGTPEDEGDYYGYCFENFNLIIITHADDLHGLWNRRARVRGSDSVVRHELGHIIGLPDTKNSRSFMYGKYSGIESYFTQRDIERIKNYRNTRCP